MLIFIRVQSGGSEEHTSITSEGDIVSETSWGNRVTIESVPYAVLMETNSVLVESYPVPGKLKTEIGSEVANRFEWRYYLRGQSGSKLKPGEGNYSPPFDRFDKLENHERTLNSTIELTAKSVAQVGKKLRINGDNIMSLEFDRFSGTVGAFVDDTIELLNITYDIAGRPFRWGPR